MWSPLRPQGHKEERGNWAKHSTLGTLYRNRGTEPKGISSRATMRRVDALTVRCPSKEPANTHNPITTHTPITYTAHNTTKHARDPIENGAHGRLEWRRGCTAWHDSNKQTEVAKASRVIHTIRPRANIQPLRCRGFTLA